MVFGVLRNIVGTLGLRLTTAPEFRGLGPRREQALARDGRRLSTSDLYMGMRTLVLRIPCEFLLASLPGRAAVLPLFLRPLSGLLQKLFVDPLRLGRGLDAQLLA